MCVCVCVIIIIIVRLNNNGMEIINTVGAYFIYQKLSTILLLYLSIIINNIIITYYK